MSARTHVLLDLDGTLSDSEPGIVRSLQWACELEGFPVPDEATVRALLVSCGRAPQAGGGRGKGLIRDGADRARVVAEVKGQTIAIEAQGLDRIALRLRAASDSARVSSSASSSERPSATSISTSSTRRFAGAGASEARRRAASFAVVKAGTDSPSPASSAAVKTW